MGQTLEKLLTVDEVAETLGIPRATIYRWRYLGKGPKGINIGKHVRFRPTDVAKWLEDQELGGTA